MRPVKFCICGGGDLAHALAAVLGSVPRVEVRLLTRSPAAWGAQVRLLYNDDLEVVGRLDCVSGAPGEVIPDADVVILALPSFARRSMLHAIRPVVKESGWGGFDWEARHELGEACRIFGCGQKDEREFRGRANSLIDVDAERETG